MLYKYASRMRTKKWTWEELQKSVANVPDEADTTPLS